MRLLALNPRWATDSYSAPSGGWRLGVTFECPCCKGTSRATRLAVFFANPPDGGVPPSNRNLWMREGDTFDTLTLTPSIDASASGHWHGFIKGGQVT